MQKSLYRLYVSLLLLSFVIAIIYSLTYIVPVIKIEYSVIIEAIVAVALFYVILRFFYFLIDSIMKEAPENAIFTVKQLILIVWLGALGVAIAAIFGVNVSSVILGSAFASIVIGLAAQTVLSNIIAGIALMIARPLRPGERLTVVTWQFGNVFPSYPPKFFSSDYLLNGYTGTVEHIGLFYTLMSDDEHGTIEIPNSVLVQALLRKYSDKITTFVRFQVQPGQDPEEALKRARNAVLRCEDVIGEPDVLIDEAVSGGGFVLRIIALCKGNRQEICRSKILKELLKEFGASR